MSKEIVLIEDESNKDLCRYNDCLKQQLEWEMKFICSNHVYVPYGCNGCKFGCWRNWFNSNRIKNCMCYRNKCVNFDPFSYINFNNIDMTVINNNVKYYIKLLKDKSQNINKII